MTKPGTNAKSIHTAWWHPARDYSRIELLCDAVVHGAGILIALAAGIAVLVIGVTSEVALGWPPLVTYFVSLITVLSVSLAYNMAPVLPIRRLFARLDQAAIFLLIAGTYTPVLALLTSTSVATWMLIFVWSAALVGIALKLFVPQRFGRVAIFLYAGIGWSGLAIFNTLAETLPVSTLWLLLAGGISYTSGIIFHLWHRLPFHNVLWHVFVVAGATLHIWAILSCMAVRA